MLWNYLERDGCFNTFECGNCEYVITAAEGEPLPRHCPNCGEESEATE